MHFRLVPKSMTLDVQIFTEFCASLHFWEATMAKRQRQKCSPMILVSGNIRRMCIFW